MGTPGTAPDLVRFALVVVCAGCVQAKRPTGPELDRGLVWMFPGIEGHAAMLEPACRALCDAGVDSAVEVYEWHCPGPFGSLANLTDEPGNRKRAAALADSISAYNREHPDRSIDLIGYSGGAGLAIMVAEALPETARLRHIILLQAAISPGYDLTTALRHVDGKLINFYSPLDWAFLGVGTSVFGTMDRKYGPGAGKLGFDIATAVPHAELRPRVEQHRWIPEMLLTGHHGGHLGPLSYAWTKKYLAPCLVDEGTQKGKPAP